MKANDRQGGFVVLELIAIAVVVGIIVLVAVRGRSTPKSPAEPKTAAPEKPSTTPVASVEVRWNLGQDGIWVATGTPPACPDPLVITSPVDTSKVSGILVPGQPRGTAWKPHGAFRFNDPDNRATIKVPMDSELIRGSRAFFNGENQYSFEFVAPCGIRYWFGHLLELDPKFLAIANKLPLVQFGPDGKPPQVQYYDIDPGVQVKTGEVIATKVGYVKDNNAVVDFGVLDLRHKNGVVLRPAWKNYSDQVDQYAICWLDILTKDDRDHLRGIFGSGDSVTGVKSDYCHYPENK